MPAEIAVAPGTTAPDALGDRAHAGERGAAAPRPSGATAMTPRQPKPAVADALGEGSAVVGLALPRVPGRR